jgi:predicted permease
MSSYLEVAFRLFRRSIAANLCTVATFTVGIGAAVLAFSFVNGTILAGLPYPNADRLVWVSSGTMTLPFGSFEFVSDKDLEAWRKHSRFVADWALYQTGEATVANGAMAIRTGTAKVGDSFLGVFGAVPLQGRNFLKEETIGPRGAAVAIIADSLRQRFNASAGSTIRIDGNGYQVIGVLPPAFKFPDSTDVGVLTPLPSEGPSENTKVIAKLLPGVSFNVAKLELQSIHSAIPGLNRNKPIAFESLLRRQTAKARPTLIAVFIAANMVWVIACLNLASMVLATGVRRRSEIAVRAALGATPRMLFRQFLSEYGTLAAVGCTLGVAVAYLARGSILKLVPFSTVKAVESNFDTRVLAYAVGIAGAGTLFLSAIMLWVTTSFHGPDLLRSAPGSVSQSGHKGLLGFAIVAEFAATVVVLVGVISTSYGFFQQRYRQLGFNESGLLTFQVTFPENTYRGPRQRAFLNSVKERIGYLPGVKAVSLCSSLPPSPLALVVFYAPGVTADGNLPPMVSQQIVDSNYFKLMGIPLVAGRSLTKQDDEADTKTAVVNRALARRYFGSEGNAVGQKVSVPGLRDLSIVGVIADVKNSGLAKDPEPEIYLGPGETTAPVVTFVAVTSLENPSSLTGTVEQSVRSVDPGFAASQIETMEQRLTNTVASLRFAMVLLFLFGAVAVFLSLIGIYGVNAYALGSRSREIAVRTALGATPLQIVRPVVIEMLTMCGVGTCVAIEIGVWTRQLLSDVLSQSTASGTILIVVSVVAAIVACGAAYIPARLILEADVSQALKA